MSLLQRVGSKTTIYDFLIANGRIDSKAFITEEKRLRRRKANKKKSKEQLFKEEKKRVMKKLQPA